MHYRLFGAHDKHVMVDSKLKHIIDVFKKTCNSRSTPSNIQWFQICKKKDDVTSFVNFHSVNLASSYIYFVQLTFQWEYFFVGNWTYAKFSLQIIHFSRANISNWMSQKKKFKLKRVSEHIFARKSIRLMCLLNKHLYIKIWCLVRFFGLFSRCIFLYPIGSKSIKSNVSVRNQSNVSVRFGDLWGCHSPRQNDDWTKRWNGFTANVSH